MSPRERRLRERIDVLTNRLHAAHERAALKRVSNGGQAVRHCVYCGHRTRSSRVIPVCPGHTDLTSLDPLYTEARL